MFQIAQRIHAARGDIFRVEHGHRDRHVLNALFTLARGHQDFLRCDGGFRRKRRHRQRCGERRECDACE